MIEKIDTKEWIDKLQKVLLQFLHYKPELSLQGSKIYDGNYNRDANDLQFRILSRNTPKNMAIHVETIAPPKRFSPQSSYNCASQTRQRSAWL